MTSLTSDDLPYEVTVQCNEFTILLDMNCFMFLLQHNRQSQSTLNTPVVSLQTPGIISTYSPMNSFGAQDFSMNSDVMGIASWNNSHPNLNSVHHAR